MIELKELRVAYGEKEVLKGVTTVFAQGAFTCVIGPNGGGKSTLLRAMAGLAAYRGTVRVDGADLQELSRRGRAQRLAYLPQTRPVPDIDARTLIAHGRFPHLGFSKTLTARDRELVEQAAVRTGCAAFLDRKLGELSGGERQRVYLAMVVAQDARTILLDEPCTYLDIRHQLELLELLQSLHASGRSVIMVAHDLPQAFACATELKVLDGGALAAEGTPESLFGHPAVPHAFGVAVARDERPDSLYHCRLAAPPEGPGPGAGESLR